MIALCFAAWVALLQEPKKDEAPPPKLSKEQLAAAGKVAGLEFTDQELELMQRGVDEQLDGYEKLFGHHLDNSVAPVLGFARCVENLSLAAPVAPLPRVERVLPEVARPANLEELCYADIPTLASLIHARKVSCSELTEMYLARLK